MTTSFIVGLRSILVLSKTFGIISITYTFESGLLIKTSSIMVYNCLEITRMIVLIWFTYIFHLNNTFLLRDLVLLNFWSSVVMARVNELCIIKYYHTLFIILLLLLWYVTNKTFIAINYCYIHTYYSMGKLNCTVYIFIKQKS